MKIAEVRQRMVECMRLQRLSPATVKAYLSWVEQFAAFVVAQPAGVSHEEKIGAFLSHLVQVKSDVASPLDTRKASAA